jgi:hypothetical protein
MAGIVMRSADFGGNWTVCHWLCQCFSSTQEDTGKASGTPIAPSAEAPSLIAAKGSTAPLHRSQCKNLFQFRAG